jgi:hypothetical protein
MTPEQQVAFQNRMLQEWAAETLAVLRQVIRERVGYVPTTLFDSLKGRVLDGAASDARGEFQLDFLDAGRHVDMKRLQWSRRPITTDENFILDWVNRLGMDKFKFVPGYPSGSRVQISREKQAQRIASAIIVAKGRNLKARRRKTMNKWYNEIFYSRVEILIRRLLDEQAQFVLRETVKDLSKNLDGTSQAG